MTTTTNYGYTVVVGSDTPVNIQNDIAPNFTAIDTDLKAVSDSAITVATHTVSGTVHNLVRADADRNALYFVATGDMVLGDTFTVDGMAVTARLVNGEALATGSFKINNNVFGILVGTILNLNVPSSSTDASDVTYDNTGSGLVATNVQNAIDEMVADIPANASDLSYDNTSSGLSASNTQDAIDEVASSLGKLKALCSATYVTNGISIALSEAYTHFDALLIEVSNALNGARARMGTVQPVIDTWFSSGTLGNANTDFTIEMTSTTSALIGNKTGVWPATYVTIYGIKF